jgi:hypothetical protein
LGICDQFFITATAVEDMSGLIQFGLGVALITCEILDGSHGKVRIYLSTVDKKAEQAQIDQEHANCVKFHRANAGYTVSKLTIKSLSDSVWLYRLGNQDYSLIMSYLADFLVSAWDITKASLFDVKRFQELVAIVRGRITSLVANLQESAKILYNQFLAMCSEIEKTAGRVYFAVSTLWKWMGKNWWALLQTGLSWAMDTIRVYAYTYYFQTLAVIIEINDRIGKRTRVSIQFYYRSTCVLTSRCCFLFILIAKLGGAGKGGKSLHLD